ncbi:hypothetical protein [Pseudomonas aeruginosa]|uniref:hypothetical protein n=1 Tax=Pseudomonas aeruginosa TaxID=287 RepID=UPI0012DD072C|nr:hypothetical protein [Pseudomonas aeruginosa]
MRETYVSPDIRLIESLYDLDLLEALHTVLQHVWLPPSTFFVANELIAANKVSEALDDYIPKPLSSFFEGHLRKLMENLAITPDSEGGWEIWSRVSGADSPSFGYLHVDNDESLRAKEGKLLAPLYGTILYVGPREGVEGGETAFLTENAPHVMGNVFTKLSKEDFSSSVFSLVSPRAGRLTIFRGHVPHAIMWAKIDSGKPRVTLLANYWRERISSVPHGVCAISPNEYKGVR